MPALIQFVGAWSRGGFSTNAMTSPSARVGTTPNADGSSTRVSEIVASAPRASWNATNAREIEVGEHVAVAHDQALVDALGREADAARGPERLVLDDEAQLHVAVALVGEVLGERVGQVAEREHRLVDAVRREPVELALHERDVRDREQRLRRRVGERPQPGARAADEDDGLHGVELLLVLPAEVVDEVAVGRSVALDAGVLDTGAVSETRHRRRRRRGDRRTGRRGR